MGQRGVSSIQQRNNHSMSYQHMEALADSIRASISLSSQQLRVEHATQLAAKHREEQLSEGSAPWKCMSDKFSILEPELRTRILALSENTAWTKVAVESRKFDLSTHV